jgi:hypothetical protein
VLLACKPSDPRKQSSGTYSADKKPIPFLFSAGLLSAGAMGFWHGVEYYEKERVVGEEFYQQWNNVSPSAGLGRNFVDRRVTPLTVC